MNFESFLKYIISKKNIIKNKKKIKKILRLYYLQLNFNKSKLKLGKITFEYNNYKNENLFFENSFILKFVNNDELIDEFEKIKKFFKSFDWKWDFNNVCSLLIILFIIITYFFIILNNWINDIFFFIFKHKTQFKYIFSYFLNILFSCFKLLVIKTFEDINDNLLEFLINNLIN